MRYLNAYHAPVMGYFNPHRSADGQGVRLHRGPEILYADLVPPTNPVNSPRPLTPLNGYFKQISTRYRDK